MAKIEFPKPLKLLLEGSELLAPIRALADQVGVILADNKLPFFPDYTDHGTEHIQCVLKSQVELVPKEVWEGSKADSNPRLLGAADAAVIIGATLLHDIGMHLRPAGFRKLIAKGSRFQPLRWFKEAHTDHTADRPWDELWAEYAREARRFSDRDLAKIIGEESAQVWKFDKLPEDEGQWQRNHCLVIGEFIRRHHARLAHEIAMCGMPGVEKGAGEHQFPAMGTETGHKLRTLADLIGLTARSHGTSLRVCQAYLEKHYAKQPRPMGTAVLYPMALLRVADYLQIDGKRAPAVLLQLRQPQSPVSVMEWAKHRAVEHIGPANDHRCKMVTVSKDVTLPVYLQLRDLLVGLQAEMDHSTAVLDEAYGRCTDLGLDKLNLSMRRVDSNLQQPAFIDELKYVPERTGFSADPNLLTLLVEPLYGNHPGVGVRELMQNALDAVCELHAWCETHQRPIADIDLPEQEADVLIEYIKREDSTWFLRVRDKGIGMTSDTLQHYFLRAGASFRRSTEWATEFLDENGKPRVARAGRFGIGVFAVFLLGPEFRVFTRHVSADASSGYKLTATNNSQLIEICRADNLRVGTTIEIDLSHATSIHFGLEYNNSFGLSDPLSTIDWFCWDWPKVEKRIIRGPNAVPALQKFHAPIRRTKLPPEWSVIHPDGFDAVHWTYAEAPRLSCNGLRIQDISAPRAGEYFDWNNKTWELEQPKIAVTDSRANLPLTTQRFALSQSTLPFIDSLSRDVMLSFIGHALVCGPMSRQEALLTKIGHPLRMVQTTFFGDDLNFRDYDESDKPFAHGRLRWCANFSGFVPIDPWLYTLLNSSSCVILGSMATRGSDLPDKLEAVSAQLDQLLPQESSLLLWRSMTCSHSDASEYEIRHAWFTSMEVLSSLSKKGVAALGQDLTASTIVISATEEVFFHSKKNHTNEEFVVPDGFKFEAWKQFREGSPRRARMCNQSDGFIPSAQLLPMLETLETTLISQDELSHSRGQKCDPEFFFVAEIETRPQNISPQSLLAHLWNEFLGARPIPFDPTARQQMIAEAGQKPELKRHLDAWEKLKQQGSRHCTAGK